MMARFCLGALALAAAGCAAAEDPAPAGAWRVDCDNTGGCVALALGAESSDIGFVRLGSDAAGALVAHLGAPLPEDGRDGQVEASLEGRRLFTAPGKADGMVLLATLSGDEARRFVAALSKAPSIRLRRVGAEDGVTLQVAGAEAAAKRVTARPTAPAVSLAAVPVPQVALPPVSLFKAEVVPDCVDAAEGAGDPKVARLGPDRLLWSVRCETFAYQGSTAFLLSDGKGGGMTPAPLRSEAGEPPNVLLGAKYDPATGRLQSVEVGRAMGDCGVEEQRVWDGTAFRLVYRRAMEPCRGLPQALWPVTYRADVR